MRHLTSTRNINVCVNTKIYCKCPLTFTQPHALEAVNHPKFANLRMVFLLLWLSNSEYMRVIKWLFEKLSLGTIGESRQYYLIDNTGIIVTLRMTI